MATDGLDFVAFHDLKYKWISATEGYKLKLQITNQQPC